MGESAVGTGLWCDSSGKTDKDKAIGDLSEPTELYQEASEIIGHSQEPVTGRRNQRGTQRKTDITEESTAWYDRCDHWL